MNAKDHLDLADKRLADLRANYGRWDQAEAVALVLEAIAHTTAAIAIELGAPHDNTPSGVTNAAS